MLNHVSTQDINLLNLYFSTKTLGEAKLSCNDEARQLLKAGLTDPSVRDAVSSLRTLREDLETSGDYPMRIADHTPGFEYGLQQYNMALAGLTSKMSSTGSNGLKSALLCCHVFISIEQVQDNHSAMVKHIIQGLRIMREYGPRPRLSVENEFVPPLHDQLPFLDVFIIKLFTAPCKFAQLSKTTQSSEATPPASAKLPCQRFAEAQNLRAIVPNIRTKLTRIAASMLAFLDRVLQVKCAEHALQLIPEKAILLDSLDSWLMDVESFQIELGSSDPGPISLSFMRMFHLVLNVVLLGMLDSTQDFRIKLQTASDHLQVQAKIVDERLKEYRAQNGTGCSGGEQSTLV